MEGSVIPKAIGWAIFSACGAVVVNMVAYDPSHAESTIASTWFSYSFLLSFLIVFRTQSAYSRYWEGASILQAIRGDFLNATSCMFAFCTQDPAKKADVRLFQHTIVRMMSLLHCSGLQSVACMENEAFEVFELDGFGDESISHLNMNKEEKTLIILQWVQKVVIHNMNIGVINIAPPIASRLFQQLGQGVIQISAARKIADIPFPFPYAQMVTLLLVGCTIVTPLIIGLMIESTKWAGSLTFIGIFGFWSINYIAIEIEMPFGDDKNDLPISEMQEQFNKSLALLLQPLTQVPPKFVATPEQLASDLLRVQTCNIGLEERPTKKTDPTHHHSGLDAVHTAVHNADVAVHKVIGKAGELAHNMHLHHDLHHGGGHNPESVGHHPDADKQAMSSHQPVEKGGGQKVILGPESLGHVEDCENREFLQRAEMERQQLIALGLRIEERLEKVSVDVLSMSTASSKIAGFLERYCQRAAIAL